MRDRFRSKDKTVFLFMIILIVILLLGIGYAIIQTFSSIDFKEEETGKANIVFTDYKTYGDGDISANIDSNNPSKGSFSISNLIGYGDTSTIEYTIENQEEVPLKLEIIKSNLTNNSYFTLESNIDQLNKTTIQPHEKKTLIIHVKVVKVYIDEENKTINTKANILIKAKPVK